MKKGLNEKIAILAVVIIGVAGVCWIHYGISSNRPPLPKYTILDEDVYDAPIKTQRNINVLVAPDTSKELLTNLLNDLYVRALKEGGRYHNHATHVAIYAYTSKQAAEAETGGWAAMLIKNGVDDSPKISLAKQGQGGG